MLKGAADCAASREKPLRRSDRSAAATVPKKDSKSWKPSVAEMKAAQEKQGEKLRSIALKLETDIIPDSKGVAEGRQHLLETLAHKGKH